MNRRTQASLLALALLVVSVVAMVAQPVPWVVYAPGPTLDVLGEYDGEAIIDVKDRKEYRDNGDLLMLTVISSTPREKVELFAVVAAWLDPARAVYPYDLIYAPQDTEQSVREQSQQQMSSSQDNARAAALAALDVPFEGWVEVTEVDPKGGSAGKLAKGDRLQAINGVAVQNVPELFRQMQKVRPGGEVVVTASRAGVTTEHRIRTKPSEGEPRRALIGVGIQQEFRFPFEVDLNISENIGGPSAGMMFSVAIYDVLTPGSLTDGKKIAGTGEVDPEGTIGAIGGLQQKLAAAQRDDARLFLVPADNCKEAMTSSFDRDKMRLLRADNVAQVIDQIEKWADHPRAELTECAS